MSLRAKMLIAVFAVAFVSLPFAVDAALTQTQVDSILNLLQSFGADQATIDNVNAALTGQPTSGGGTGSAAACSFTRNLNVGTSGADVQCLQQYLNSAGFTVAQSGVGSPGNETQFFGSLTQSAVVRWQNANAAQVLAPVGLSAGTGFWGPSSIAHYNSLDASGDTGTDTGDDTTPPAQAGTVSVSLASDNPAAQTIVTDDDGGVAQLAVPFLSARFTAPSSGSVTVNTLKLTRRGVSSDSDLINTWLYEGNRRVAIGGSISGNVVTFNNPNGLFTVPAGQSKIITFRGDLKENAGSGKTIAFDIESRSDVTTSGATVNGSFPLSGNLMSTADASDLGYVDVAGTYTNPSSNNTSIAPEDDQEVWSFQLTANDQDIDLYRFNFTKVGSADQNDLENFRLLAGGTEIASASQMNSDFEVYMDLSSNPYRIDQGQSKTFSLRADIVGGSTRDFKFTFQQQDDVLAMDASFDVFVDVNTSTGQTWSVIQPDGDWQVETGSLSVSRATDSPSGNVAKDATNETLARYDFTASGEDVKIRNLGISADTSNADGIDNGKVLLNGVQVGSTDDIGEYPTATTTFTFGSSFIVTAGETATVEIVGDVKDTSGGSHDSGDSVTIYLAKGSSNAQGQDSLTSLNIPSAQSAGNALTVQSGALTISENTALADDNIVAGTNGATVGSFILTAGSGEGVDVDSITATLESTGNDETDDVQNMKLMRDGVQIGTVKTSPSTSNLYSVSFSLAAGESTRIDLVADVASGADSTDWDAQMDATATGATSGDSISVTAVEIQSHDLSATGSLTAAKDASSPDSDIVVANASNVDFSVFKFTATTEAFTVEKMKFITASNTQDNIASVEISYPTTSGTRTQSGFFDSSGHVTFNDMTFYIPADDNAKLTVSANLATMTGAGAADSGDETSIDWDVYGDFQATSASGTTDTNAQTGSLVSVSSNVTGNDMVVRKTVPTITTAAADTQLVNGDVWAGKFTVSADSNEDVSWSLAGFNVDLSDADGGGELRFNTLKIYKESDLSTALTASATSATSSDPVKIEMSSEEVVPAGTSKTYRIKATGMLGVEADDAFVLTFDTPYTTTATAKYTTVDDNETAFIWSDNSASSHSFTTADWANAEFVDTLPSSSWVLSQ